MPDVSTSILRPMTPDALLDPSPPSTGRSRSRSSTVAESSESTPLLIPAGEGKSGHDHFSHRSPWLRAAVLGANDGLVSTASVMLGVLAGGGDHRVVLLSGLATLVAGALSMAAGECKQTVEYEGIANSFFRSGEYVSVHSQRDAELADIDRERAEFHRSKRPFPAELAELTQIYIARGMPERLATEVAEFFHHTYSVEDLVHVHARDELGIDADDLSNPWQAAVTSALSYAAGAVLPLLGAGFLVDPAMQIVILIVVSCIGLVFFGAVGAALGGAHIVPAALRVLLGGALAMMGTYGAGKAFGVVAG